MPSTIIEWIMAGFSIVISLAILTGFGLVGYGLYYLLTSPVVTNWLGY